MIWTDNFIQYGEKYYHGVNRNFIKATAYWIYATALAKRIYVRLGQLRLYPNMYLILMAHRKRGKTLLTTTAEQIIHTTLPFQAKLPTDFSDEGFDDKLGDSQGYGYLHYRELIELLAHLDKAKKAVAKFNTFYDWSPIETSSYTRTGGNRVIPGGTIMAFISGITPGAFSTGMRQTVLTSGGLSRFLIMREDNREPLPPPPDTPEELVPLLTTALKESLSNDQTEIVLNADAKDYWRYLNETQLNEFAKISADPQMFGDVTARADQYLLKCAMVRAYQSHSVMITHEHIEAAYEDVIKPYLYTALRIAEDGIATNEYQQYRQRVFDVIKEQRVVTARDLMRALKVKKNALAEILESLEAERYIEIENLGRNQRRITYTDVFAQAKHTNGHTNDAHQAQNGHHANGAASQSQTFSRQTQL